MNNNLYTMPVTLEGDYCNVSYLEAIGDNLLEIRRCIGEMGYDISDLSSTLTKIESGLLPSQLKPRFTAYETYIYRIGHFALDYVTDNTFAEYSRVYQWQNRPIDIRNQIQRWFRWSNEQKEVIDYADANTQPLVTNNKELTRDKNNDIIYVEVA